MINWPCPTPALSWSCSELLCCLFIFCFERCGVCARVSNGCSNGCCGALGGECTCRAPGPPAGTRSRGLSGVGAGRGGARGSSIGMRKLSRQLTLLAWWSGCPVTPQICHCHHHLIQRIPSHQHGFPSTIPPSQKLQLENSTTRVWFSQPVLVGLIRSFLGTVQSPQKWIWSWSLFSPWIALKIVTKRPFLLGRPEWSLIACVFPLDLHFLGFTSLFSHASPWEKTMGERRYWRFVCKQNAELLVKVHLVCLHFLQAESGIFGGPMSGRSLRM